MKITYQGVEVELKLRVGFTVHNPDGTAYLPVFVDAVLPPIPPNGDGGEPLPLPRAA